MRLSPRRRLTLRIGGVFLIIGAAVAAIAGVVPRAPASSDPITVTPGLPANLPSSGFFANRTLLLYGSVQGERPTEADLGCRLLDGNGVRTSPSKVSALGALGGKRREVAGVPLDPLVRVRGFDSGWALVCEGDSLERLRPLYLFENARTPYPRVLLLAFSLLSGLLGLAALWLLRSP